MAQRLVELGHLLGARPLLRTEHRRGATRAAQRVVDIGCNHHLNLRQPGIQPGQVYLTEARQRGAAQGQLLPLAIQKTHTQRRSSRPAPPSLVALPPRPSTMRRTPASSAARINSPVP